MKNLWFIPLFLLMTFISSCEEDHVDESKAKDAVAVDSELFKLIEKVASKDFKTEISCIDFNYPFTLIIFNEENFILGYQSISNDEDFSEFLGTLGNGYSISLSYPITSYLENGEPYEINTNEDLKMAIDNCVRVDDLHYCNGVFTPQNCIWKVTDVDGTNTEYNGAFFEPTKLGTIGFQHNKNSYAGTWTTYFIEDTLRLNIYLLNDGEIAQTWNYDWKNTIIDESHMEIENGIDHFLLTKECVESCRKFVFEECETIPGIGVADFDLPGYQECFFPFSGFSDPSMVTISYFETFENAEQNMNPIVEFPYQNAVNPQNIYVRFEENATGNSTIISILIKAVACE